MKISKKKKDLVETTKDKPGSTAPKRDELQRRYIRRRPDTPTLRFSPLAWAKLQYFCHHDDCEIGGFGITSANDLLCIEDFVTVKQKVSVVSVAFDDTAVADFFEDQVDVGRKPDQFARIWLHTHPGSSPTPSGTDEDTFSRVFGKCDWAIMFILAKGGETYCRLRFNSGPGAAINLPVQVDYSLPFDGSDHQLWQDEYKRNIEIERFVGRGFNFDGFDKKSNGRLKSLDEWDDEFNDDPMFDHLVGDEEYDDMLDLDDFFDSIQGV